MPHGGPDVVGQARRGGQGWLLLGIPEPSRRMVSWAGSQGEVGRARVVGQLSAQIGTG